MQVRVGIEIRSEIKVMEAAVASPNPNPNPKVTDVAKGKIRIDAMVMLRLGVALG